MQTFITSSDIEEVAWTLDPKIKGHPSSGRAPKNVLETSQIIDAILREQFSWDAGRKKNGDPRVIPWSRHSITMLWKDHLDALCNYFNTMYKVIILERRCWKKENKLAARYPITRLPCPLTGSLRWVDPEAPLPPVVASEAFQASHRAALLKKFPLWYEQFSWKEDPKIEYIWK